MDKTLTFAFLSKAKKKDFISRKKIYKLKNEFLIWIIKIKNVSIPKQYLQLTFIIATLKNHF